MARPHQIASGLGVVLLLTGGLLLATVVGRIDGFFGGAALGAGVMLLLLGAWVIGARWRHPTGSDDDTWLPSADGDR